MVVIAQVEGSGSPGVVLGRYCIFEILRGAGDIHNSTSMPNYCDGPFIHLLLCAKQLLSAWTEVWIGSYRSRAKVLAPGGRSGQILHF